MKGYCIILLILFLGSTCRKKNIPDAKRYEEDPATTKVDELQRLSGTWIIKDFTFNGSSIFDKINKTTFVNPILDNISFYYEQKSKENGWEAKLRLNPKGGANWFCNCTDSIKFSSNDSSLSFSLITPFKKTNSHVYSKWKITKLFDTEWNIKMQTDSGAYKIFWKLKSK